MSGYLDTLGTLPAWDPNSRENFQPLVASVPSSYSPPTQKLKRDRRKPDISTAISTTGWVASATHTEVRLYRVGDDVDRTKKIKVDITIAPKLKRDGGKYDREDILAVAISDDLLAILTHDRLMMCKYRELKAEIFDIKNINDGGSWMPESVSLLQRGSVAPGSEVTAWVAVGGDGEVGVKLFKYSYLRNWNAQSDKVTLKCSLKSTENTSSIRIVEFSPHQFNGENSFLILGVSTSNQIFLWNVQAHNRNGPSLQSSLPLNCSLRKNDASHRGGITSASIFLSPSPPRKPYIFCTSMQRHGSQNYSSFIGSIKRFQPGEEEAIVQFHALPESVAGKDVLAGITTSNGQFATVVEGKELRLVSFKGAWNGGITCASNPLVWTSPLRAGVPDAPAISLSVMEYRERLEIVGVDPKGQIVWVTVNVPNMSVRTDPSIHSRVRSEISDQGAIFEASCSERSGSAADVGKTEDLDRIEAVKRWSNSLGFQPANTVWL